MSELIKILKRLPHYGAFCVQTVDAKRKNQSRLPLEVELPNALLVEKILERQFPIEPVTDAMVMMEQAVHDPLFMDDLNETMSAFSDIDAEWWEPSP